MRGRGCSVDKGLLVLSVGVEERLPCGSLRTTLAPEYQQARSIDAFEVYVLGGSSMHLSRHAVKVYVVFCISRVLPQTTANASTTW